MFSVEHNALINGDRITIILRAVMTMSDVEDIVLGVYNRNSNADPWVTFTSTVQAIVACDEGQTVSVNLVTACTIHDGINHFNQFTGILVKEGLE